MSWFTADYNQWSKANGPVRFDTVIVKPPGKCQHPGDDDDWPEEIAYVDRDWANVLLAAPDLLSACESLLGLPLLTVVSGDSKQANEALDAMRKAVAKAKGE